MADHDSHLEALAGPLSGIRVLDFTQFLSGPFGTQILGDLGAQVIKIEPPSGDLSRSVPPNLVEGDSSYFLSVNRNKRSVVIDLKSEIGADLALRMMDACDVVIENNRPGVMDRLGLGYDVLSAAHPGLIYVSVSGFGNLGDSPYRDWPAYAMVPEAMSGLYDYARQGDEPPRVVPAGALGDISSGLFAVIGVMAALRQRDRTGKGQFVDIAMLDAMVAMADVVTNFWSLGKRGNELEVLMNSFQAADGWFAMQVARENQFEALAELVGNPEWKDDPRFSTRKGWADHCEDVVRPAVTAWAADKTRIEVCDVPR